MGYQYCKTNGGHCTPACTQVITESCVFGLYNVQNGGVVSGFPSTVRFTFGYMRCYVRCCVMSKQHMIFFNKHDTKCCSFLADVAESTQ